MPFDAQVGRTAQHCDMTSGAVPATISAKSFSAPGSGSELTLILGFFCVKRAAPFAEASTMGAPAPCQVVQRRVTSRVPTVEGGAPVPWAPGAQAARAAAGSAALALRRRVRRVRCCAVDVYPVSY